MKIRRTILVCVMLLAVGCGGSDLASTSSSPLPTLAPDLSAQSCTMRPATNGQPLPDPVCTPGAINPDVTDVNQNDTICKSGWTKTVRPPPSYTNRLKTSQIAAYGYSDTNVRDYEEDHLISLELGGSPTDPKNLWPEPGASPNPKDKVENALHTLVCTGKMSLTDAQQKIATDWTTALP